MRQEPCDIYNVRYATPVSLHWICNGGLKRAPEGEVCAEKSRYQEQNLSAFERKLRNHQQFISQEVMPQLRSRAARQPVHPPGSPTPPQRPKLQRKL